jgi:glycerate 2-kinase
VSSLAGRGRDLVKPAPGPDRPPKIRNIETLLDHGQAELRSLALQVAMAGLAACDVGAATERAVSLNGDRLRVGSSEHMLDPEGRVVILGAGKASLRIAAALECVLDDRVDSGVVAARVGEEFPLRRVEVVSADHPLPTARSSEAAERLLELASGLCERDLVLACFTGGSSALASLPPPGVATQEKRALHRALLASGMPIAEVNSIRKHVSRIKGGRLAAVAAPARIINITASDVVGNHLDTITDPTVQDTTTAARAIEILVEYGLWDSVPQSIRDHLGEPGAESPSLADVEIHSEVLVDGSAVCDAMAAHAGELGVEAVVVSTTLEGEAREVGAQLADLATAGNVQRSRSNVPYVLVGCGGETTVTLSEQAEFGAGGPNQEAALGFALALDDAAEITAAFLDTDGSDGGTDAAGAVADGHTAARARALGIDLSRALETNRARACLHDLRDLVDTGPTGTNLNDLFVVAVRKGP